MSHDMAMSNEMSRWKDAYSMILKKSRLSLSKWIPRDNQILKKKLNLDLDRLARIRRELSRKYEDKILVRFGHKSGLNSSWRSNQRSNCSKYEHLWPTRPNSSFLLPCSLPVATGSKISTECSETGKMFLVGRPWIRRTVPESSSWCSRRCTIVEVRELSTRVHCAPK